MLCVKIGDKYWGRIYKEFSCMLDYSKGLPDKETFCRIMGSPVSPDRAYLIEQNAETHAPYVNYHSALERLSGTEDGATCLYIGAGPSAAGVAGRIAQHRHLPNFKVATLNLGNTLVHNPDYFTCYERLSKPEWWANTDPDRTKLLTSPMCKREILDKWRGRNTWYSWVADMRGSDDPRWACLEPVISGLTTAVCGLHALAKLGFKRILLVGYDFSVSNPPPHDGQGVSGTFYADGTGVEDSYVKHENFGYIIGIEEKPCLVTPSQWAHMRAMAAACFIAEDAGVEIVNCCGQGILEAPHTSKLEDELEKVCLEANCLNTPQITAETAKQIRTTVSSLEQQKRDSKTSKVSTSGHTTERLSDLTLGPQTAQEPSPLTP